MSSRLPSSTIRVNRALVDQLYLGDRTGHTPSAVQALVIVQLLHELFHHFVPVFLSHLYASSPPVQTSASAPPTPPKPPSLSTLVKIQAWKKGKGEDRGKAGELSEMELCGFVLHHSRPSLV